MEIKTKFGPAAILMDTTGTKMGFVKKVVISVIEGGTGPLIEYVVQVKDITNVIMEKDAILLVPTTENKSEEKQKEKLSVAA